MRAKSGMNFCRRIHQVIQLEWQLIQLCAHSSPIWVMPVEIFEESIRMLRLDQMNHFTNNHIFKYVTGFLD